MSEVLAHLREVLGGRPAWLVGGAVRDELLGLPPATDLDLIVEGDPAGHARAFARRCAGAPFELSEQWGAWRIVARAGGWQVDLNPLRGGSLEADLRGRDFTVNAIARDLHSGELCDPLSGALDVERRALRLASPSALLEDPLRALRLVRLACELDLEPDQQARAAARISAAELNAVAAERVMSELVRIVASVRAVPGMAMLRALGLSAALLPEWDALAGVEQSHFHHLDVLGHTLGVLEAAIELAAAPERLFGDADGAAVRALLAEGLGGGVTRGVALRFGALLHDIAKPQTRDVLDGGRVIFPGHDAAGADTVRAILGRLRAGERLRSHVAALTEHHLRLGFLVHRMPLSRRDLHSYLRVSGSVAADVTLLSCADRLATRGRNSGGAIARHLQLAREVIGPALHWHREGPPAPLVRGDELADAAGIPRGPRLGELLAELEAAQFAGEVRTREQAIEYARARIA
ncbi:MAG: CCA tRNA nucleotidyltransferase [Solirubrobacteraceae bacterium]